MTNETIKLLETLDADASFVISHRKYVNIDQSHPKFKVIRIHVANLLHVCKRTLRDVTNSTCDPNTILLELVGQGIEITVRDGGLSVIRHRADVYSAYDDPIETNNALDKLITEILTTTIKNG